MTTHSSCVGEFGCVASASITHDARGNLTGDGSNTYTYDIYNRLLTRSGGMNATLGYDPAGRLNAMAAAGVNTSFVYDGVSLIEERDGSGNVQRRHVHGPGVDEPIVTYQCVSACTSPTPTYQRQWLIADERGSIVAATADNGAAITINSYDEYGQPAAGNYGRFQFTGQAWLAEAQF